MDLNFTDILSNIKKTTEENSFIKILNAVNNELNKEDDVIDIDEMIKVIEENSPFEDPVLTTGLLNSYITGHYNRRVNIARSFSTTDFI